MIYDFLYFYIVSFFFGNIISINLAVLLDFIFGDPHFRLHPIRIFGDLINLEKRIFDCLGLSNFMQFIFGAICTLFNVAIVFFIFLYLEILLFNYSFLLYIIFQSIFIYFSVSLKSLIVESKKVLSSIKKSIEESRKNLSMIVGRDTNNLDEVGIYRAVIETVSENFSDGVIAPLFYATLGGAKFSLVYKMINTMDSMWGYKNEVYNYLGKFAARLDDLVNLIPARMSAILLILINKPTLKVFKMYFKYRYAHLSPNSAHTESAVAAILDLKLGGGNFYHGKYVEKPWIGEGNDPTQSDVIKSFRLIIKAEFLYLVIINIILWRIYLW